MYGKSHARLDPTRVRRKWNWGLTFVLCLCLSVDWCDARQGPIPLAQSSFCITGICSSFQCQNVYLDFETPSICCKPKLRSIYAFLHWEDAFEWGSSKEALHQWSCSELSSSCLDIILLGSNAFTAKMSCTAAAGSWSLPWLQLSSQALGYAALRLDLGFKAQSFNPKVSGRTAMYSMRL